MDEQTNGAFRPLIWFWSFIRGLRTVVLAALGLVVGVAEIAIQVFNPWDFHYLIPPEWMGFVLTVFAGLSLLVRLVTNGPVKWKQVDDPAEGIHPDFPDVAAKAEFEYPSELGFGFGSGFDPGRSEPAKKPKLKRRGRVVRKPLKRRGRR